MNIQVRVMSKIQEPEYQELLNNSRNSMFNHSIKYRNFLKLIFPEAEDIYFLAYKEDKLVAAFPTFVKYGPIGPVVNSLPFYGSHGGIVLRENLSLDLELEIGAALIKAMRDHSSNIGAALSVVIESPLDNQKELYGKLFGTDITDQRIGQITEMPRKDNEVESSIMNLCHQKTRNMIRKGIRAGFDVLHEGSNWSIDVLHQIHFQNMESIGGLAKPLSVFQAIKSEFAYDLDYRIYIAKKDNEVAAAMLVFYFKDMVEYFTPAVSAKYRSEQPLSLLIFSAMKDAIVSRSARFWNWGGTWLNQDGVYLFKSRWGTKDYTYKYYITKYNSQLDFSNLSKAELLRDYQYFYTVPFNLLDLS
jgi:hypothetical protein